MHNSAERAVERAIDTMLEKLSDQLTIDDIARAAMFSKFHFTRIFQRVTGVSPGRFLSAIRLQEAKRLLVTTRLNVADISLRVGYNSVGTFSTRFTRSVGMSPTMYRRLGGFTHHIPTKDADTSAHATVEGTVYAPPQPHQPGLLFVGLFPQPIPEGPPVGCVVLDELGPYRLTHVPEGTWYLLCHSMSGDVLSAQQQDMSVATVGPCTVHGNATVTVNVHLKPASKLDPPVLLALLDSRKTALGRLTASAGRTA